MNGLPPDSPWLSASPTPHQSPPAHCPTSRFVYAGSYETCIIHHSHTSQNKQTNKQQQQQKTTILPSQKGLLFAFDSTYSSAFLLVVEDQCSVLLELLPPLHGLEVCLFLSRHGSARERSGHLTSSTVICMRVFSSARVSSWSGLSTCSLDAKMAATFFSSSVVGCMGDLREIEEHRVESIQSRNEHNHFMLVKQFQDFDVSFPLYTDRK